jgi:succinyl-diaminopimelate desuccinylase
MSTFLAAAKQLLAIESTADRPADLHAAVDFIADTLADEKEITIERFERNNKPSLLAYFGPTRPKQFKILFNGHIDVVSGSSEQFKPFVKDGNLYARGASDMKVATLTMADVFKRHCADLDYPLGLQIVSDEEVGGFDGTLYQLEQGICTDLMVGGESIEENRSCIESRGLCWADIKISGLSSHGAYVWQGENAILNTQHFIDKLLAAYPVPTEPQWVTTVNVAAINTPNTTYNRVPDEVKIRLDIRYLPEDEHFKDETSAREFLESLCPSKSVVDIVMFEPGHKADVKHPLIMQLAAAHQEITGNSLEFIKKYGGADTRFYSARGMQAITYGLPSRNIHSDNENIPIDSINHYAEVLSQFLRSL